MVFALQTTAFRQPESKKSRQRCPPLAAKELREKAKPQQELNSLSVYKMDL